MNKIELINEISTWKYKYVNGWCNIKGTISNRRNDYRRNDYDIIIPFRGSKLRNKLLNNVIQQLNIMLENPNIIIAEHGYKKTFVNKFENVSFYHLKAEKNDLFDRTGTLNFLIKKTSNRVVINHDADCILEKEAYISAINLIYNRKYKLIIPYNGLGYNVSSNFSFKNNYNIKNGFNGEIQYLRWRSACGGIIVIDRRTYIESGMENPNIISWGYEDFERIYRFKNLGHGIAGGHNSEDQRKHEACKFIKFCSVFRNNSLYHLDHDKERGANSSKNPNVAHNKKVAKDMLFSDKSKILLEVKGWFK